MCVWGGGSYPVETIAKRDGGKEGDRNEIDVAAHPGSLPQVGQHERRVGHKRKAGPHRILAKVPDICSEVETLMLLSHNQASE